MTQLLTDECSLVGCALAALKKYTCSGAEFRHTLTTEAVSPAALEDLPEVYTALGRKPATYFRIWDLAQEGSPTMATLMSPLRLMPCQPTVKCQLATDSASHECYFSAMRQQNRGMLNATAGFEPSIHTLLNQQTAHGSCPLVAAMIRALE